MSNILVVDDEAGIRELLQEILFDEGHQVRLAENAVEARLAFDQTPPDLVLLDIWMPDTDGITLLKEWSASGKLHMPVIMMSGHGTIDTAVEATKIGAFDFLEKPIALQKLLHTVSRALKQNAGRNKPGNGFSLLGKSPVIQDLQNRLLLLAKYRGPILFLGQQGSPFELAAQILHTLDTPWLVPDDLAWLASNPLDVLIKAEGGTLLLKEIANLGKLEQRGLMLLISRMEKHHVRLFCCSAENLSSRVADHSFDADLYQSLSAVSLLFPNLRDHRDDIPEIANHLMLLLVENKSISPKSFNTAALNALRLYDWPFNLGQLQNVVHTLALTTLSDEITVTDVKLVLSQFLDEGVTITKNNPFSFDLPLREARDHFERLYFEHHLVKADGNMSRIADTVGLERTHLYRKLKQLDIKFSRKSE